MPEQFATMRYPSRLLSRYHASSPSARANKIFTPAPVYYCAWCLMLFDVVIRDAIMLYDNIRCDMVALPRLFFANMSIRCFYAALPSPTEWETPRLQPLSLPPSIPRVVLCLCVCSAFACKCRRHCRRDTGMAAEQITFIPSFIAPSAA